MLTLVRFFFDLCLLRAKPQDLPASDFLLGVTLSCYTLIGIATSTAVLPLQQAVLSSLLSALLLAILTHTTLMLRGFAGRLNQTLSALAGSGSLLGLIVWPLTASQAPLLLVAAMVIWSLAVTAHILRHALSMSFSAGIAISVGYLLVSFIIMNSLFPAVS